jgi:glycine cleavage system H protein
MEFPENLKYSEDHEWVKVEGNIAYIGITDFAQSELGDIVYVDVDPELSEVTANEVFGTVEAVKTVSDLLAPVSGKVVELNPKLEDEPQLVNTDPYGEGWIIKIEIEDLESVNTLLSAEDYAKQIGG